MSCTLEPAIWSRDSGQPRPCFDRCQLIITWMSNVHGFMTLSTYSLEDDRHLARLHHRRRRRACAPTSNTASHDNHEKITSWVTFSFLYGYGAPLGARSSAKANCWLRILMNKQTDWKTYQSNIICASIMTKRKTIFPAPWEIWTLDPWFTSPVL